MSKTLTFNSYAAQATRMVERGCDPQDLVHESYGQLSSAITLKDYQRGGYTSRYYTLAEVMAGALPSEEIEADEWPRAECPTFIQGGFQRSATLFTVDKKGRAKRVAWSDDCTYQDDKPSAKIKVPDAPRILIKFSTYGNGGRDTYRYYA